MRKIVQSLLISLVLGAGSLGIIYIINTNFIKQDLLDAPEQKLIAKITGAVDEPGDYFFNKNETIREIIFKAKVKSCADIYLLGLEMKQTKSFEILVPYKIGKAPKLKFSEIKEISQLKAIGIKDNIAKTIIKYRKENKGIPTWKNIDDLPGIGAKTLAYLKEYIELS